MTSGHPLRVDGADDIVERYVDVRECFEVALADRRQQLGERRRGIQRAPQCEGVHEHAHDSLQFGLEPAGHGGADQHIGPRTHAVHQNRERGVHQHERADTFSACEFGDGTAQIIVDGQHRVSATVCGGGIEAGGCLCLRRDRGIDRGIGEYTPPVIDLPGRGAAGIVG